MKKIKKTFRLSEVAVENISAIKKEYAFEGVSCSDSLIIELALNEFLKKEMEKDDRTNES